MRKALIITLTFAVALLFVLSVAATPTAVGAEKCKMCHKVQYESWTASKHAAQNPKVDCEHCHGLGSDYTPIATMKDPAKAKAAGLVIPDKTKCAECHGKAKVPPMTDDLFGKVHAHKAK